MALPIRLSSHCATTATSSIRATAISVRTRASSTQPGTTLGRFKTIASQVEIEIGGVIIHPGDIVVGDIDGVVVVPKAKAEEVLAMSEEIDKRELEQAKLIIAERSLRKGLAKYGRI
jgi:4-hydroxy-4-methyl-2-oxoglutarate aldolase